MAWHTATRSDYQDAQCADNVGVIVSGYVYTAKLIVHPYSDLSEQAKKDQLHIVAFQKNKGGELINRWMGVR